MRHRLGFDVAQLSNDVEDLGPKAAQALPLLALLAVRDRRDQRDRRVDLRSENWNKFLAFDHSNISMPFIRFYQHY